MAPSPNPLFVLVFHGLRSGDLTLDGEEAILDGDRLTVANAGAGFSLRVGGG